MYIDVLNKNILVQMVNISDKYELWEKIYNSIKQHIEFAYIVSFFNSEYDGIKTLIPSQIKTIADKPNTLVILDNLHIIYNSYEPQIHELLDNPNITVISLAPTRSSISIEYEEQIDYSFSKISKYFPYTSISMYNNAVNTKDTLHLTDWKTINQFRDSISKNKYYCCMDNNNNNSYWIHIDDVHDIIIDHNHNKKIISTLR